ncbi:MAG: hypothetical protein NZ750_12965 [Anaerolineae bacterium]|nr:hypothetical protein [Anaerolineae bacterium]MDW8173687.1 hypothetical protein [Anaerolineae bacterium]
MSSETQLFSILIILVAFVVNAVVRRRTPPPLRPLPALETLETLTALSVEDSRPLHLSLGAAQLGSEDTLLALVGAEFLYESARRVAASDAAPFITFGDAATLPLARDTLRRAFDDSGALANYRLAQARWIPATRPLALAGGLMALQSDDRPAGNLLIGRFGPELALVLDAANRRRCPTIATSANLEGQAVAYALASAPLIGEEVFAAAAYLSADPTEAKRLIVTDLLRWLTILALVVLLAVALLRGVA